MNKNILLINPSQHGIYGNFSPPDYMPLGLGYIGAVLEKEGYTVRIIDIDASKLTRQRFMNILQRFSPFIVGITATTPAFKNALGVARFVKDNIKTTIVFGGIHVTLAPEESIKHDLIDYIVRGEGEATIVELANALSANKSDVSKIDGLVYRKAGEVVTTKPRALIDDLNSLPFPARHLFSRSKYTYADALYYPAFPIMTSRGCPGQCTYCCTKHLFTQRFRCRSAENIVDEIEMLVKSQGAREIHIWDDNFTLAKHRVFKVCDELARRGIKVKFSFPNGLRVDQVDYEILKALKKMGTYSVAFGVESGTQEVLDHVRKGITLEQVRKAFATAKKVGLETWAFFLLGLPNDTPATIRQTVRFAKELDPDVAKFHILKPYPHSEAYDELKALNLITEWRYERYGIHTPPVHRLPGISPKRLLKMQKEAYRSFYLRPRILVKQVLRLSTWTRVRLNIRTGLTIFKTMFKA